MFECMCVCVLRVACCGCVLCVRMYVFERVCVRLRACTCMCVYFFCTPACARVFCVCVYLHVCAHARSSVHTRVHLRALKKSVQAPARFGKPRSNHEVVTLSRLFAMDDKQRMGRSCNGAEESFLATEIAGCRDGFSGHLVQLIVCQVQFVAKEKMPNEEGPNAMQQNHVQHAQLQSR